jgi:hypothetical protein
MLKRNLFAAATLLFLFSSASHAGAVYWTVKPSGILVTSSGRVVIQHSTSTPTGPSPAGTQWTQCSQRMIILDKKLTGEEVTDKYLDRMLSVALAAQKTGSRLRLRIERDNNNNCYSSQVYDVGL